MPGLKVLNLSGKSFPVEENGFFQLLDTPDLMVQDSTAFLKDYRDLMGRLSTYMASRLWWSTHIASKNRFAAICCSSLLTHAPTFALLKPNIFTISRNVTSAPSR